MASEEELKAEIKRLHAENEALKGPRGQLSRKGEREGWAFGLRTGALSSHALPNEQWENLLADEIARLFGKTSRQ